MDTFIIEASQPSAQVVRANGDYRVNLAQPVRIETGDVVSLKMASIDTQAVNNQSIVISEDTQLSMAFAYYDICVSVDGIDKLKLSDGATAPPNSCKPHLFYYSNSSPGYSSVYTQEYSAFNLIPEGPSSDISWGTYTPGVNNVRVEMFGTWVDVYGKIQTATFVADSTQNPADFPAGGTTYRVHPTNSTQTLPAPNTGKMQFICNQPDTFGTWQDGSLSFSGFKMYHGFPTPNIDVSNRLNINNFSIAPFVQNPSRTGSGPTDNLVIRTRSITLPKGVYDPEELAVKLTILLNEAKPIKISPSGGVPTHYAWNSSNDFLINIKEWDYTNNPEFKRFESPVDSSHDYFYKDATFSDGALMIGAANVVIEYGKNGAIYQLSQSFTNLASPTTTPQPSAGVFAYSDSYRVATQGTGIVFTDLQPAAFWRDTLGLYDALIAPIELDNLKMTIPALESYLTYGAFVNADMVPLLKRDGLRQADMPRYFDLTGIDNIPLLGQPPNVQADKSGFYLIETRSAGLNSNYIDDKSNRQAILGVVSKQYIQANCVTGFEGDSAIQYVHRGMPFDMTYLDIRILDGFSKEVDTSLGPKNTVFLKVERPAPKPYEGKKKVTVGKKK